MRAPTSSRRNIAKIAGVLVLALVSLAIGAVFFAWSGLYSVAASEGHLAIVDRFLRFGMQSSVQTHSRDIVAPDLSDVDLLPLGAAHYYSGCMPCHGAPGHAPNSVFQQSLPSPPDLTNARSTWRDRELFWLIKHGLKYTGMPGWSARDRNDEQWAVVAFLKRLPDLSKEQYEELALGGYSQNRVAKDEPAKTFGTDVAQCARCHGDHDTAPASALVPSLLGQSESYLIYALNEYSRGARQSGVMQPIASTLSAEQKLAYAKYYSSAPPSRRASTDGNNDTLVFKGDARRGIPACDSCHGGSRHEAYPALAGLSEKYLVAQLKLWRDNIPRHGALADLMAPVAVKLTDHEIEELAAYYSGAASTPGGGDAETR